MKIIAHRGGAKLAPENSLEAIRVSKNLGVDAAEIDIRITKDNRLVVFHDDDLSRLADIDRDISDLTVAEIQNIKLNNGTTIPTLEELLKVSGDLPLVIEGKDEGWALKLSRILKPYQHKKSLRVISFEEDELAKFAELEPKIKCLLLGTIKAKKTIKAARNRGFYGVDIHYMGINPRVAKATRKHGLDLVLYTVNSPIVVKIIRHFYPDVSITTDAPDKLLNLVKPIDE